MIKHVEHGSDNKELAYEEGNAEDKRSYNHADRLINVQKQSFFKNSIAGFLKTQSSLISTYNDIGQKSLFIFIES